MQEKQGTELDLKSWIEQLRFEVLALTGHIQVLLYSVFLFLIFYTLIVAIANANAVAFGTPIQAWEVIIFALFFFVVWAFEDAQARRALIRDYQQLLREIYVNSLDLQTISTRYETIKRETPDRLKWWRARRRK